MFKMPTIRKCFLNDYDIENDELYENEEVYEDEFNNGQNTIKCGEIILFKYNLLISCNYCEETLSNYDIFTKHLFEKHLNYDLNQLKVNNDNDTKEILEEFTNDLIYSNNDLKFEQMPIAHTPSPPPNCSNLSYFNNELEEQSTKYKPIEEVNYNNLYFINPTVSIEIPETISPEIHVPGINNIVKDTKTIEIQQNKFIPTMGNSFKINSETYEEKFYKYCKLFKEKEANLSRENDKFKNEIQVKSNIDEDISGELNSNKLNQQINYFIEEIPINIQLEENSDIFDDNLIDDIIEEDASALSFIENHTENIDVIEETVSFSEHNHTENIDIDSKIAIKLETEIAIENLVKIQNNNDINVENLSETGNISNVKLENQIDNNYENQINKSTIINNVDAITTDYVDRKQITAISTKRNNYYHCPECSRYYTRFETLKIHYRSHTGEKNPYNCSICDKSFSAPCKLIQHQRVHTGERPYKCSLCPQAFKAKQKLKNHLESHQKGTIKRPAIYIDGMSILERQPACLPILINNKFITSSEAKKEDGLYHCPICERKYRRFESLKEHSDIHVDLKQYECHICNKHFTKIRSLRVHLKSHTPNKNIRWNGTPISCDFCEKTFNNKYYLNEHLSVHSGKRPYECNICNKKFTFKSNFVLHERTHSGDKRYQCSYCNMRFVQSTTKVRHERVVHLKLPPFTCRYCHKGFYTLSIYKKHINDHKNNDDEIFTSSEYKEEILNENDENNVIVNDNVEQTIIVDNNNEENNIIVVEHEDPKVSDFICSNCGAYFVDCGQYIEHCKSHDNNINEQNIVHYMEDHIVGSEEIIV